MKSKSFRFGLLRQETPANPRVSCFESALGNARWGQAPSKPGHVRYAAAAEDNRTFTIKTSLKRDGPDTLNVVTMAPMHRACRRHSAFALVRGIGVHD